MRTHAVIGGLVAALLSAGLTLARADAPPVAREKQAVQARQAEMDEATVRRYKMLAWEEYVRRGGRDPIAGASADVTFKDGKVEVFMKFARIGVGVHFTIVFDEKTGKILEYVPGL